MKTILFSAFIALFILNFFTQLSTADVCGTVNMKAASCITFATGKAPSPAPACCSGLQQLAQGVKTVDDKKAICRCLKAGVKNFAGVQDRFLSQIPNACKIKVGFPVSMNTDCEKLH